MEAGHSKADRDEKNARWRFHISMKLEKTAVKDARSSKGCGVSSDVIIGAKKCCESSSVSVNWKL